MNVKTYTINNDRCTGPNAVCRKHHRDGRSIHARPNLRGVVWPRYHFADEADVARMADREVMTVRSDDDLYEARRDGVPYFLPEGWKDPAQRLADADTLLGYRVTIETFTDTALVWSCTCGHGFAGHPDDLPDPSFEGLPVRTVTFRHTHRA